MEQVAQRPDVSLYALSGANRMAAARQQTLRTTIHWSHKLFQRPSGRSSGELSVFARGWTLEAAEGVWSGGGV